MKCTVHRPINLQINVLNILVLCFLTLNFNFFSGKWIKSFVSTACNVFFLSLRKKLVNTWMYPTKSDRLVTKFLFSLSSNSGKSTADWKQLIQFQRKDSNAYNCAVRHFEILFSKRLDCHCHSSFLIWGWVRLNTVKCLRVFKLRSFIPTIFSRFLSCRAVVSWK